MTEPAAPPLSHVAIIMDGNGRWAKARGLPRIFGHRQGVEAVRRTVRACLDIGITHLTLFGFSSENWRRPEREVRDLMHLLRFYLRSEIASLHAESIRVRIIGQRHRLPQALMTLVDHAETITRNNKRLNLTVALSYGGRDEIVTATRALIDAVKAGTIDSEMVDEALFTRHLFTAEIPDPDLIIRSSGEKRISNFLLWQCAYSEMIFLDTLWPEFTRGHLEDAIREFQGRERRFGATSLGTPV
jgi:undecaprenyl diphosphate synthase